MDNDSSSRADAENGAAPVQKFADPVAPGTAARGALSSQLAAVSAVESWPSTATKLNGLQSFSVVDDKVERQYSRASPYNLRW